VVPPQPEVIDTKALGGKWPRIGIVYIVAFLSTANNFEKYWQFL